MPARPPFCPLQPTRPRGPIARFSLEQSLRPWHEVAREWNRRSGQTLSRARVWQIAMIAQRKIREAIVGMEDDSSDG